MTRQTLHGKLPDLLGAGFAIVLGLFVLFESSHYTLGTLRDMGPGYFPRMFSVLLIILGALLALAALLSKDTAERISLPRLGSVIFIGAAFISFALLIDRFGMIPAVFSAVFLSTFASSNVRIGRSLVLSAATACACAALFVFALGLPIKVFAL